MLEFFITTYGNKLIGLAILALFGCLGYAAKKICKAYLDDDTKRAVAMTAGISTARTSSGRRWRPQRAFSRKRVFPSTPMK